MNNIIYKQERGLYNTRYTLILAIVIAWLVNFPYGINGNNKKGGYQVSTRNEGVSEYKTAKRHTFTSTARKT